jgi:3-mercaptopropionate dioxygenase
MSADASLHGFLDCCRAAVAAGDRPSDIVRRIAPAMLRLMPSAPTLLTEAHRRSDPDQYARNLVWAEPDGTLSLFALVWRPGQWTPIHDHGTWGVVGIAEGLLEEQAFMRTDANPDEPRNTGIRLVPGGLVLLPPGSVSTFVPNPDHIHQTGVPDDQPLTVSLHLYGRMLNSFHVYDRGAGTRRLINAAHTDS